MITENGFAGRSALPVGHHLLLLLLLLACCCCCLLLAATAACCLLLLLAAAAAAALRLLRLLLLRLRLFLPSPPTVLSTTPQCLLAQVFAVFFNAVQDTRYMIYFRVNHQEHEVHGGGGDGALLVDNFSEMVGLRRAATAAPWCAKDCAGQLAIGSRQLRPC